MKKLVILLSLISLSVLASEEQVQKALLEGSGTQIRYGEVTKLVLSVWPINSEELAALSQLSAHSLGEGLVVLRYGKPVISLHNSEAATVEIEGVFTGEFSASTFMFEDKEIELMRRGLNVQEFGPLSEEVHFFHDLFLDSTKSLIRFLVILFFMALTVYVLWKRQRKTFVPFEKKWMKSFVKYYLSLSEEQKIEQLYHQKSNLIKYSKLPLEEMFYRVADKNVFKKELSESEKEELGIALKKIDQEIEKWSS